MTLTDQRNFLVWKPAVNAKKIYTDDDNADAVV